MAKIEVDRYLGSSQDNFIVFANEEYEKPFISFYMSGTGNTGEIVISDANDEDGYKKVIKYSASEQITDSSFNSYGDATMATYNMLECLRRNPIFYDWEIITNVPNVGVVIKASIDTSTRYEVTTGNGVVVGGTYASWAAKEPNKFVLVENNGEKHIFLEKYTMNDDVSFNVTAPFEHISMKDTFEVTLDSYRVVNNVVYFNTIANNTVVVFPTTLTKFDDTDLSDFEGKFLTHNFKRIYNYDELCALSVMSDINVSIIKKYYTNSGVYLMQDADVVYSERHPMRNDFYFKLDIEYVESETNRQVGYVEVYVAVNGIATNAKPVVYTVDAKCNDNNEIFFVNEIGGIDSFNFLGERTYSSKIDNQTTYFVNPTRKYSDIKELEVIGQHKNNVEHNLKTTIIDSDTAIWLNEMQKSKYHFLFNEEGSARFERIIITDMDIDVSDRNNTFEIEMTYQDGDVNISI